MAMAAPPTPEMETDYAAALQWWVVSSPPQCATVTLEMQPTDPQGNGKMASAWMPEPGQSELPCRIYAYEDQWSSESSCMREMVMRHEVGHTLGLDHSTEPASIMYPVISRAVWCPGDYVQAEAGSSQTLSAAIYLEWMAIRKRCMHFSTHASARRVIWCWSLARSAKREYHEARKATPSD